LIGGAEMIFHIALKDLKIVFRDKKALAVMLLMPALIIMILGAAFSSMFSSGNTIEKFSIGVVNRDDGLLSKIFINEVLRKEMKDMLNTYVVYEDEADRMLEKKTVPAVIVIPEDFTRNIESNKPTKLQVKSHADAQLKSIVVESVTGGFAQSISLSYASAYAALDTFNKYHLPTPKPVGGIAASTAIMGELQKKLSTGLLDYKEENQDEQKSMNAIQFYSASMLVMFLLFGANNGIALMIEERESRTLSRVLSTRPGRGTVLTGKFLGLMVICFIQAMILILFTRIVYNVNWGDSLPGLLMVTICAVFAAAGFGMMIAGVARTQKAADGLSNILIQVFTFIGGGMIPYYVMPDSMKQLAKVTLNWWAVKGYHDLMLGINFVNILPYCGILLIMGLAYLSIGILKFRTE
jgi:ABC-2 type transport system permease protein